MVPTRIHCTDCGCWRLTAVNFHVKQWGSDGHAVRLQRRCMTCTRVSGRIRAGARRRGAPYQPRRTGLGQAERAAAARVSYGVRRDEILDRRRRQYGYRRRASEVVGSSDNPLLPNGPFQSWLQRVVMENGITGTAAQLNADPSFVKRIHDGVFLDKKGRWRPQYHVRASLVDRWMLSFGEQMSSIYPYDEYHKED